MKALQFLILVGLRQAATQNLNPNPNNRKFDPDSTQTEICNIPPYQDVKNSFRPDATMCQEPDPTLTLDDARALAVDYAPHLFFHPLEEYTLTDVDLALADPNAGKVYFNSKTVEVFSDTINQTAMLVSTRDPLLGLSSTKYFFTHNDSLPDGGLYSHDYFNPPGYLKGSGYDDQGRTNAPIYYRVFDSGNNTWTFNYWFYYAFNGHANMGVLSSYNGNETYTPFQLRPIGQHEGDFEGISVMVCKSSVASQPLAVTYRQHSWSEIVNCLEGQCHFFKDTFQSVGFAALNSHATYTTPTRNMIYANVAIPYFVNLQGVLVVDRTEFRDAQGNYKQFLPTESNVVLLNEVTDIVLGETPEQFYWQAWGGAFGDVTKPSVDGGDPYCLAADQQSFSDCPTEEEDPIFTLVMQFMGVYPVNGTNAALINQAAGLVSGATRELFTETGNAPEGPQRKSYYDDWTGAKNAPLWGSVSSNTTEEEYCKRLQEIPDLSRTTLDSSEVDLTGNLVGILVVSILLPFVTAIWYLWPRIRGAAFEDVIKFDEEGNMLEPDRAAWWKVHRPALVFTFFIVVGLAGVFTFAYGYQELFNLLDDLVGGGTWDFVTTMLLALGIIVIVLDVCLFITIWIPTVALWKHIWIAYYEGVGDQEKAEEKRKSYFAKNFAAKHVLYVVFFSLLFLSLMITAVCAIVAAGVVGFSYGFTKLCDETLGSIDGICLDLSFIGVEEVACGPDFQQFCADWGKAARSQTLWGAFLLLWAHFYFIAAAGEAYYSQVSIYPSLVANRRLRQSLLARKSVFDNKDMDSQNKETDSQTMEGAMPVGVEHVVQDDGEQHLVS